MQKIKRKKLLACSIMLTLVAIGYVYRFLTVPLDSDPKADRQMRTKSMLWLCGAAATQWTLEHGRAPTSSEGLSVLPLRRFPMLDGWKQPIIYRAKGVNAPLEFHIYSVGPNGLDEGGSGDDVSFEKGQIQ